MVLQETEMMVQTVLADTILTACRKTLPYQIKFTIEGMLHITLDEKEIILVNVKDTILKSDEKELTELTELKEDVIQTPKRGPVAKRKRGRRKKKVKYVESDEDFEPLPDDGSESDKVTEFPNLYSQMYTEEDKETGDANIKEEPCEGNGSKSESVIGAQETTAQLVDLAIQLAGVQENQDIKTSNEPPTSQEKHPNQSGVSDAKRRSRSAKLRVRLGVKKREALKGKRNTQNQQEKEEEREGGDKDENDTVRIRGRPKGQKREVCYICGKWMVRGHLNIHLRIHSTDRPFKCQFCTADFKSKAHLNIHERIHTGVKPYKCEFCTKMFVTDGQRKCHERTHTGERPFQCAHCGFRAARKYTIECHERTHTGEKPYKCNFCELKFTDKQQKRIHEKIHTGDKRFECQYCSKRFQRKHHLVIHERTHTGEKPYTCEFCGKGFADQRNLVPHIRTHTGEKPHKCVICGLGFERARSLSEHMGDHLKTREEQMMKFAPVLPSSELNEAQEEDVVSSILRMPEKQHKCVICGVNFEKQSALNNHLAEHVKVGDDAVVEQIKYKSTPAIVQSQGPAPVHAHDVMVMSQEGQDQTPEAYIDAGLNDINHPVAYVSIITSSAESQ